MTVSQDKRFLHYLAKDEIRYLKLPESRVVLIVVTETRHCFSGVILSKKRSGLVDTCLLKNLHLILGLTRTHCFIYLSLNFLVYKNAEFGQGDF